MTPAETARVLAKASAFDQRTIGETDTRAWHEILDRVDYADALAAVTRHYRDETRRIMPADIVRHCRAIRTERDRAAKRDDGPRALPGRYESDITRDIRNERGLAQARGVLAQIGARLEAQRAGQERAS